MGEKIKISKCTFFLIHLNYLQSKNQLHSTYKTSEKCTESISQKSHFKVRDPFSAKIGPFLLRIFKNPQSWQLFVVLYALVHQVTWKTIKNQVWHHFGSRKSLFGPFFAIFLYHKFILEKSDIHHTRLSSDANISS